MAFAVLEGADLVFPSLGLGPRVYNALVLLGLLGFPVALVLAWTFDLTDRGLLRTAPAVAGAPEVPDRWARPKAVLVGAGFVALLWIGAGLWRPADVGGEGLVPARAPVLAVLPFQDLSPEGDRAYFADGFHEELLHQLARIPGLRLISRTSVLHFRGSPATLGTIADSLGARFVLEGSVRTTPDSLQLTVQLVDAATDEHLWSEAYARAVTLSGLFDLQRTLAMRVAGSLGATLTGDPADALGRPPTRSLEAYHAYLRGLHQWSRVDLAAWWAAVDEWERAVALDPGFGRAHARLAVALGALNNYGGGTQGELFPRIREHAEQAVRHAPDEPDSHLAAMAIQWPIEWDWVGVRAGLERALELDPGHVDALWALAELHGVVAGNTDRGLELLRRADALDPFSVQLLNMRWWILFNGRRFDEALETALRIEALEPGNGTQALNLASTLALVGRVEDARSRLDPVVAGMAAPLPVVLVPHLARVGDRERARRVLEGAVALKASGGSVPASGIAAGYAALGEVEPALEWLERGFREEGGIYFLRSPDWDAVAGEPRFQALWDRVGLGGTHPALAGGD